MAFSIYQASATALARILTQLSAILDKAEAHCTAKKIAPEALLQFRLYPDMFPLMRQVQIATDMSKGCVARLAGADIPSYADTETSFADLKARLAKTIAFIESFKPEQIEGAEDRTILVKTGGQERSFKGSDYVLFFVLPNVHFHATTTYDILRHCGVELGKKDYTGV
jgi:hypothetical protein